MTTPFYSSTYLPDTRPSEFSQTKSWRLQGIRVCPMEPAQRSDRRHSCCCTSSKQQPEKTSMTASTPRDRTSYPRRERILHTLHFELPLDRCYFKFNSIHHWGRGRLLRESMQHRKKRCKLCDLWGAGHVFNFLLTVSLQGFSE